MAIPRAQGNGRKEKLGLWRNIPAWSPAPQRTVAFFDLQRGDKVIKKRHVWGVALCGVLVMGGFFIAHFTFASQRDYLRLVELIQVETKETPLQVFNEFEEGFDEDSHRSNLQYFNENPGLVRRINKDLDGEEVEWRLDNLKQRLLFVPEERKEYAALLEDYCRDVIRYVLNRTDLKNPYDNIETLGQERPKISGSNVTAFLVNNLAEESICTYTFSNHKKKAVKIELRCTVFLGEVGSYTTNIHLKDNGTFDFTRNNYTIWQTSAENPYKVLMVPVEETLHILLREHTHRAIREQIKRQSGTDIKDVKRIVEEWVAVEEAIVGALVHVLLPSFLREYSSNLPHAYIQKAMESMEKFEKYRYLERGIEVINGMGFQAALRLYIKDPKKFKQFLT